MPKNRNPARHNVFSKPRRWSKIKKKKIFAVIILAKYRLILKIRKFEMLVPQFGIFIKFIVTIILDSKGEYEDINIGNEKPHLPLERPDNISLAGNQKSDAQRIFVPNEDIHRNLNEPKSLDHKIL